MYGSDVTGKTRFKDEDMVFYLTEVVNGNEEVLIDSVQYKSINNAKIWVDTFKANTTKEESHTYRLRMWLSENILISDTNPNATYTSEQFRNGYANVKTNVIGNLQKNDINMILNANDDNIINGKRAVDVKSYGYQGDTLKLEITSSNSNIKFQYEDEKGNSSTVNNDSLTLNYSGLNNGRVTTRVSLISANDANTKGNSWLDYPVGLINVDEVMMAGGVYNMHNEKYYLYNDTFYWTGSPGYFYASRAGAYAWLVYPSGHVYQSNYVTVSRGVRPVINLSSSIVITQGDGSIENPFVIN